MPRKYGYRSLYTGKGHDYSTECFQICPDCGASMFRSEIDKHDKFHEDIDELIDWARSVSELFKRPESDSGADKPSNDGSDAIQHAEGESYIFENERGTFRIQEGPGTPD